MSEFEAPCGCEIHVAQWTSKRKIASVKNCPLHKSASELLKACKAALIVCSYADDGRIVSPETEEAERLLKSAIGKAEGRP